MGASAAEFESLEQQFLELMGEFRTIHVSLFLINSDIIFLTAHEGLILQSKL